MNFCSCYVTERTITKSGSSCSKAVDCGEVSAEFKCAIPDASNTVSDGCARKASALFECAISDAGDTVGDVDARQASAVIECAIPDA